jgi:CO dehydrogenase maturation factor
VQGIDAFVAVVEPGSRSIETANNIAKMAKELGIGCVGTIANKITEPAQVEVIKSQLKDTVLLGTLRYSRSLQEADLRRAPVFGADAEVTEHLKQAKNKLVDLISLSSSKVKKQ